MPPSGVVTYLEFEIFYEPEFTVNDFNTVCVQPLSGSSSPSIKVQEYLPSHLEFHFVFPFFRPKS